MAPRTFTLASRASQLAQIQTNSVVAALEALPPSPDAAGAPRFAASFLSTAGDRNQSQALSLAGGTAFWTGDLEAALRGGAADMLVHCLKDVPTALRAGCVIGAVLAREDAVDSLVVRKGKEGVWTKLEDLPEGSVVGTSSVRRVAQLRRAFPGLQFMDCRGNVDTRLAKLDAPDSPYAALILAKAGLVRTGMRARIAADVRPPTMYPAAGQGALALEIRADDAAARALCARLAHRPTLWATAAERACLRGLEGGCSVPVGVWTDLDDARGVLELTGCVTSLDGTKHVQHTLTETVGSVEDAEALGARLAEALIESGAGAILAEINGDKERRVKEAEAAEKA